MQNLVVKFANRFGKIATKPQGVFLFDSHCRLVGLSFLDLVMGLAITRRGQPTEPLANIVLRLQTSNF